MTRNGALGPKINQKSAIYAKITWKLGGGATWTALERSCHFRILSWHGRGSDHKFGFNGTRGRQDISLDHFCSLNTDKWWNFMTWNIVFSSAQVLDTFRNKPRSYVLIVNNIPMGFGTCSNLEETQNFRLFPDFMVCRIQIRSQIRSQWNPPTLRHQHRPFLLTKYR